MRLNKRLKMIIDLIPKCKIVADIGTDHAYIPIYAVKTGLCDRALAMDVRTGPLAVASANIERYGLEKRVETRHGDGLEAVGLSECDVVVIAGMGGLLIRDILLSAVEKTKAASMLILQPNNGVEVLRKWLYENGFDVISEKLVQDAGKLYCAIMAKWSGKAEKKDEFTYYVGEKIFQGNESLIEKYLCKKLKDLEVIIEGRSRKRNKKKTVPYDECFDSGADISERGATAENAHIAGINDGIGRISEMSIETLICMRDKIKMILDGLK